jgi:uncharacterized protein (DUF2164 family)
MAIELTKQQTEDVVHSLRKYFREELDQEIPEMRARFLLEYVLKEIAPFAYNKGVKDVESRLRATIEDLPSICFEEELGYWRGKKRYEG